MALESSIIQAVRVYEEPVEIHQLALYLHVNTNDTGEMQKLRNTLRGMVHKRQLLSRNGLDGILRYMLPGSPIARVVSAPQIEPAAASAAPAETVPAEIDPQSPQIPAAQACPSANSAGAEAVPAIELGIALGRLGSKTLLVYQALREGEWVDRGTLDFRTKLSSSEVLTGLIALRKRGLVVAQGKTSNMQWARTETAESSTAGLSARTEMLESFDEAGAISAAVDVAVAAPSQAPTHRAMRLDERYALDADDARRYRWLMQNATISISIGAVSMKTECSPAAPGAKLLWDGAIDAILSLTGHHVATA